MPAKGGNALDDKARREVYLQHRIEGIPPTQAARLAGYTNPKESCRDLEKMPDIQDIIAANISNSRLEAKYTRDATLGVIEEAINMAKLIADPSSMIRGAQEINKMQGYYAPETKEIVLSDDTANKLNQISQLSEAELLERLGKNEAYIDAEFERIDND